MKKIVFTFIIMIIALFAGITTVQAASFEVKITPSSTEVKRGETVKVVVSAKNLSFEDDRGLVGFTGVLDYDKNVFNELTLGENYLAKDFEAGKGWGFPNFQPEDNSVACTYGGWLKADADIFTVTFTVKDAAKLGSTTISLKNIVGSDGDNEVSATNVSTVLTIAEKETPQNPDNSGGTDQPIVNVKPKITVSQEKVANGVKVILTSDKELAETTGWELSADKKKLSRVYTADFNGTITVKDINGIESDPINLDVKLGNSGDTGNPGDNTPADKTAPKATVKYSKGTNGVTVTITADEQIKPVTGWTLSGDKKTLTRLFNANHTEKITIEDLSGNKSTVEIKVDLSDPNGGNGAGGQSGEPAKDPLPKAGIAYVAPAIALIALIGAGAFIRFKSMEY